MALPSLLQILPLVISICAVLVKIRLSALGLSPIAFDLPDLPSLVPDSRLVDVPIETIGDGDLLYPECLVLDPTEQFLFASLGDGRVVRINEPQKEEPKWVTLVRTGGKFVTSTMDNFGGSEDAKYVMDYRCGWGGPADDTHTEPKCGRPLGLWLSRRSTVDPDFELKVSATGGNNNQTVSKERQYDEDVLLVADAYKGFIMVTNIYAPEGQMTTLATRAATDPPDYHFSLLNAVIQIPSNGDVYLTETSTHFQRRRIFHAVMDGAATGRLLRYRRETGVVEVVATGIFMANGIALSHDETSLLIVSGVRILRYDLGSEKIDPKPFVEVMPGTGDNVKAMDHIPNGKKVNCYWAALGGTYKQPFSLLKLVSDKPWLRALLLAVVPYETIIDLIPKWTAVAVYDERGELMETLMDDGTRVDEDGKKVPLTAPWISEMEPTGDYLYLASWYNPFLGRIKRHSIGFRNQ